MITQAEHKQCMKEEGVRSTARRAAMLNAALIGAAGIFLSLPAALASAPAAVPAPAAAQAAPQVQQPTPPPGVAPDAELKSTSAILNPDSDQPLEITADETLEWRRDDKQYIARGNAVARQGDVEIRAAILSADYRESDKSAFDIYRLTAEGNVVIISRGQGVAGDKAVYDVTTGKAVMTGKALTMTTPDHTLTARDSFEYIAAEGRLTANGDVLVKHGTDRIRAEIMSAYFVKNAKGQNELTKLTAERNVVITTPTEKLHGDFGRYLASNDTAELHGNVRIERGPNVLEGARAEVNLTTHVSRMVGGTGDRVRGVFYPGSERRTPATPGVAPAPAGTAPAPARRQFIPGTPPAAAPAQAPVPAGSALNGAVVPVPPAGAVQGPVE